MATEKTPRSVAWHVVTLDLRSVKNSNDTASHTLQVRNVDSAQHVFRQRACSIRQLVAGSKTPVVNAMELGTCSNDSKEKFGSQKEFNFRAGKFIKKLRTIGRRHKKNDNDAEFSREKLRKATRLLEANGYTMDAKKDHKAETHLPKTCQKRRAALNLQSRKDHIMKILKGETDEALTRRAWVLKTNGNRVSKDDAMFHNNWFWKFDRAPQALSDTGVRGPAWLRMGYESPKILITHQPNKLPDWLQIHASMGGFFCHALGLFQQPWRHWVHHQAQSMGQDEQDHLHDCSSKGSLST